MSLLETPSGEERQRRPRRHAVTLTFSIPNSILAANEHHNLHTQTQYTMKITNKSESATVEIQKVKRRGILGKLGMKKKVVVKKEAEPVEEKPVEEAPVEETPAETPVEEKPAEPLEPEAEAPKEDEAPEAAAEERETEQEPVVETVEEETVATEPEAAPEVEEREQPEAPPTPKDVSTGFLCGCI